MITIIDYGMGNLRSVQNRFNKMGLECIISSQKDEIAKADKLILPGVGHYERAMRNLKDLKLIQSLNQKVLQEKVPILGICLGVHLFALHSDEGDCNGLGWIDSDVVRFSVSDTVKYKVPSIENRCLESGGCVGPK